MKITYNSPVILTFALISALVLILDKFTGRAFSETFFMVRGTFHITNPLDYFRIFSHIFGHADWGHLVGNFSFILLLGPILEEKYGSGNMLFMIFVTAVITGILNVLLFNSGLMGASGIVFMLILLSSFTNFRSGTIPLTFILIVIFYIGGEMYNAFSQDNISQFGHILGGICGGIFGFITQGGKESMSSPAK